MTRIALTAFAAAAVLAAGACATAPAAYQPAASARSAGYVDQRIEADRWRVTYRAPGGADAARVADLALLRAADLTLQQGRRWFVVDQRWTAEERRDTRPRAGVSVGGATGGGRSGVGVGVGVGIPIGSPAAPRATEAVIEFRTGSGPAPAGHAVYDARAVYDTIRPRV